jgi:esterase/lipase superfamily enzyme
VNPLAFLPSLSDERYLEPLRQTEIVVATGREDPNVEESRRIASVLQAKGVPASLHLWDGWAHDWPYWKEMVDVFL